jgi:hypothetical protein
MRRGGDKGLLKGDSVLRTEASAITTASERIEVALMADSIFREDRGEPVIIVKPGVELREEGSRTSAVTVWERERPDARMRLPVRPLAPKSRICISGMVRPGRSEDLVGLFCGRKGAPWVSENRKPLSN